MAADPFKGARDQLAAGRTCLEAATQALAARIETIEHQLDPTHADWHGDPRTARGELGRILTELRGLGVADAIERLAKAVTLLVSCSEPLPAEEKRHVENDVPTNWYG